MKQIYYLHEREWNKFTEEPRIQRLELYSSKHRNRGYFDLLMLEENCHSEIPAIVEKLS